MHFQQTIEKIHNYRFIFNRYISLENQKREYIKRSTSKSTKFWNFQYDFEISE